MVYFINYFTNITIMKNLLTSITVLLVLVSFNFLQAQAPKENPLSHVQPLTGQWSGSGWMRTPQGETVTFDQTEKVSSQLAGNLLVVEGIGYKSDSKDKIFQAFGVLNYSATSNEYIFNAYTLDGRYTQAKAEVEPGKLIWSFEVPNGKIKYELAFNDKEWKEDGYFSRDGENWYPFLHMELTKQ